MPIQVRFRTTCPACGDVTVRPSGVALLMDSRMTAPACAFSCPSCRADVRAPATPATAELLIGLGAEVSLCQSPAG